MPSLGITALEASRNALLSADIEPQQLDLIITATLSPDHYFPGIGVQLQHGLGLKTTPAMDIRNQCSGFLYALNTAQLYIASGQYDRVLVVGAEIHSKLIDLSTRGRDISVLFGDGSGAVVLEACEDPKGGILSFQLHSQGEHYNKLWLSRPGTAAERFVDDEVPTNEFYPQMEGRTVFKHATHRLIETLNEILDKSNLQAENIDHFLFHQANLRINEFVASRMGIPERKTHNNIQKYGNCSAASLPILLDECNKDGKIKPGDKICMAAFGAGFTWGACVLNWI